jgi:uncharacterized membrane protein YcjF (UPF0283 family)
MDKLDLTKNVASFVVGTGTTKIVTGIIQNNIVADNLYSKVTVVGAGVVIGMMAADATKSYTNAKIDEAANWWRANVKKTA